MRDVGLTTVVNPGGDVTAAVYVAAVSSTFVTFRVTVCVPASPPIAIDGWFRSLASIAGIDAGRQLHRWPCRNEK